MGKDKSIKIGYRYYFGIHMGFGKGPIDSLLEIRVGDKVAWQGNQTVTGAFQIKAGGLFGGDKGEGGIDGVVGLQMGRYDEAAFPTLQAMLTGYDLPIYPWDPVPAMPPVPAFRGVTSLYYDGEVCAMNPYPKSWKFRVRRAIKGWDNDAPWYPSRCIIPMDGGAIMAMNPAHILYEAVTNRDWGRGLDAGRLDINSYYAAANTLYNEGFGLCFRWTRQEKVTTFIQNVLDTIAGIQEIDKTTGLLKLTLIRDDYNHDTLPTFSYSNGLIQIEDVEVSAQDTSTNSVVVKYHDPVTDEDRTTSPVDNLASIQVNGGAATTTNEYLMVPTNDLAGRLAIRDLQATMGTLRRMKLHLDRRGFGIMPGTVFKISVPTHGIDSMIVRAGRVEDGTVTNAAITVTVLQDVFGLPNSTFVDTQQSEHSPPDQVPRDIDIKELREVSYRDTVRYFSPGDLQSIAITNAYVAGLAIKPNGLALNYDLWGAFSTNIADFNDGAAGDWVPSGTIGATMPATGASITVPMATAYNFDQFQVGKAAWIGKEEMVIQGVDPANGYVTFGRGALDTIPQIHTSGSRVWVYDQFQSFSPAAFVAGQTIYGKFLTHTSSGTLKLENASTTYVTLAGRQGRPYPPGNVAINGSPYNTRANYSSGDIIITYSHRDRIAQNDQLFPHTYGNIGPETGVTYEIVVRNRDNSAVLRTVAGITGTSWTYTTAMAQADGFVQNLSIELTSIRGSTRSWQTYAISITRSGMGFNLGQTLGGIN